jgi:hypothetical protein
MSNSLAIARCWGGKLEHLPPRLALCGFPDFTGTTLKDVLITRHEIDGLMDDCWSRLNRLAVTSV